MKVAIVINTSWNIYNFRLGLLKALASENFTVYAIAPKDQFSEKLQELGFHFIPIKMENKGNNPLADFYLFYQLLKIYKEIQPDVILQYTIKPNIYGTFAAHLAKRPVINNVSGLGTVFLRDNLVSKIAKRLYRFSFKYASKVFFQNSDDQALFVNAGIVKQKVTSVLPGSGINIHEFSPKPAPENSKFTFLFIGRLIFDKGIMEYLHAAQILKDKGVICKIQILGAVEPVQKLGINQEDLNKWLEKGIVEYLGFTSQVKDFIVKADCIVLPSYREGTSRTLLESASMAKPLITTDVPGCREIVMDNENGFLCKPKNSTDLANKMEMMVHLSKEAREKMGNKGRELIINNYDEKIVIEKYLATIKELLTQNINKY